MWLIIHWIQTEISHYVAYLLFLVNFRQNWVYIYFFTKSLTSESGGLYITPTIKFFLLGRQTSMNSDSTDNDSSVSIDKSFQNLNHYQKPATFCAREAFGTRFQIIKMAA